MSTIAFFAGQTANTGSLGKGVDFSLDTLVTNVGGGYDYSSGRFRAPCCGNYYFNFVASAPRNQKAALSLLKKGVPVASAWSDNNNCWSSSPNSAILTLNKNDQVWLRTTGLSSNCFNGDMYTTFTGYLIN